MTAEAKAVYYIDKSIIKINMICAHLRSTSTTPFFLRDDVALNADLDTYLHPCAGMDIIQGTNWPPSAISQPRSCLANLVVLRLLAFLYMKTSFNYRVMSDKVIINWSIATGRFGL